MESVERAIPPDDRRKCASEASRQPILNRLTMARSYSLQMPALDVMTDQEEVVRWTVSSRFGQLIFMWSDCGRWKVVADRYPLLGIGSSVLRWLETEAVARGSWFPVTRIA